MPFSLSFYLEKKEIYPPNDTFTVPRCSIERNLLHRLRGYGRTDVRCFLAVEFRHINSYIVKKQTTTPNFKFSCVANSYEHLV